MCPHRHSGDGILKQVLGYYGFKVQVKVEIPSVSQTKIRSVLRILVSNRKWIEQT